MGESRKADGHPVVQARDDWKESTTALERISQVIEATTTPKTAGEIAEAALVSTPTARKHLGSLVEIGTATAIEDSDATRYARDEDTLLYRRIRELANEQSRVDLTESIQRMRERLRELEDTYNAASPDDLASSIERDQQGTWEAVSEWRTVERNLHVAQAALNYKRARDLGAATQ